MEKTSEDKLIEHSEPMKAITIRFTQEIYDALSEIADEFEVSMATVIRLAVDNNLSKYLGEVKYINTEQAKVINHNIGTLGKELFDIKKQLKHIGRNYNQELRMKHIALKNGGTMTSDEKILDTKPIDDLMTRYEKITQELGDEIGRASCRERV